MQNYYAQTRIDEQEDTTAWIKECCDEARVRDCGNGLRTTYFETEGIMIVEGWEEWRPGYEYPKPHLHTVYTDA